MERDDQTEKTKELNQEDLVNKEKEVKFGQLFRELREKAGYSIGQLSEATRIRETFIEALEQEQFHMLPGIVFGRGFLKSICKLFGIDPNEVVEAYNRAVAANNEQKGFYKPSLKDTPSGVQLRSERPVNFVKRVWHYFYPVRFLKKVTPVGLGVMVALAVLFVFAYSGVKYFSVNEKPQNQKSEIQTAADVNKKVIVQDNPSPVENPAEKTPDEKIQNEPTQVVQDSIKPSEQKEENPIAKDNTTNVEPEKVNVTKKEVLREDFSGSGSGTQEVQILVKTPVRVKVSIDKGEWVTSDLDVSPHKFTFKDSMQLLVYNAASVEVSFNGNPLGSLGKMSHNRECIENIFPDLS